MGCVKRRGVDFAFGGIDTATGFEARDLYDISRIHQPESRRHRCAVVQERGIAHDTRGAVRAAHNDREVALGPTTKQRSDLLDIARRCEFSGG